MKILYVPFSLEDALGDLESKASKWRKDYESKGKEVVVIYHDSPAIAERENIKKALQDGNCQIYILSHGIDSPELVVANQAKYDEDYKEMAIEEVANRFKNDLVIEGFSTDNIAKLYFCDAYAKKNKPRQMAEEFRKQLGEPLQSMEIKYYSDVSICAPGMGIDDLLSSKRAVRSFLMKNDLFCFDLMCAVGRAREFRQGLNAVESRASDHAFFASAPEAIKFPKFSHPILTQLAQGLVKMVQSDKILAKNQSEIINELLLSLPRNLSDYLVDSLIVGGKNLKFEMRINKKNLEAFLMKSGVIDKPITSPVESTTPKQSWMDEDDYFGKVNTLLEPLNVDGFLALTDYDEILDMEEQLGHKSHPI
ncbi:RNA binding protein (contains ribosomal protein S1 domain) [Legionella gratiana]|uniref:RNA binding protein (Contains ribosomal protein S1 domain) n=1 Tax=Legionella gratiana TaxID=45066 RepID=A0A378JE66_9GAMM|nr:hypothetical protein [Legionella gratiana]KTD15108.1 RNA binding protein (contains ribosomal protein S1 domain) [Legionella gratiana]STX46133.1 RNA binding protein (contains ribosomal protein S1 domain) [Legionella gratiana]